MRAVLRGFESHPPHFSRHPVVGEERILEYAWRLKKNGYRESTIVSRVKMLRGLARRANLSSPEAIKAAIADLDVVRRQERESGLCLRWVLSTIRYRI